MLRCSRAVFAGLRRINVAANDGVLETAGLSILDATYVSVMLGCSIQSAPASMQVCTFHNERKREDSLNGKSKNIYSRSSLWPRGHG